MGKTYRRRNLKIRHKGISDRENSLKEDVTYEKPKRLKIDYDEPRDKLSRRGFRENVR